MKTIIILFATLVMSVSAHAGKKDLKIMGTLVNSGAKLGWSGGTATVEVSDAACRRIDDEDHYECHFKDASGKHYIEPAEEKLESLFNLLVDVEGSQEISLGVTVVRVKSIRCNLLSSTLSNASEADRAVCFVDKSAN